MSTDDRISLADSPTMRAALDEAFADTPTTYDITLVGCDASTRIFDVDLDPAELATIRRLMQLAKEAGASGCRPSLTLAESPGRPEGQLCAECWQPIPADHDRIRDRDGEWMHNTCREVPG